MHKIYNGLVEDEIMFIEEHDECETIDIAVSNDNLFIANGILTHNSAVNGTKPNLEHVSESMGLAHTADFMAALFQEDGDDELSIVKMGIIKNRFAEAFGIMPMAVDYNTLTVSEEPDYVGGDDIEESQRSLDKILGTNLNS